VTAEPGATGFTQLGEEELLAGRLVTFARVRMLGPDGREFHREVLRHPGVVAVVPLHDDHTVTLVRQYRTAVDRLVLELPAGMRDIEGEPPEQAAQRELAEEAGLAAERLDHLTTYFAAPGLTDEEILLYLARGLTDVPIEPHGPEEEAMTIERIPLDRALAMADHGEIVDAKTIIGLALAARRV
jgi:8-oxo-dGTP pyrophosphatase MutT (NUDIX family)